MKERNKEDFIEIREKILKGLSLAFERLVAAKAKDDGYLIFSKDGVITKVRARDIQK